MPKFSQKSESLLNGCDIRLQKICNLAIELMDFTIITGYRDEIAQNKAFNEGRSKLLYPYSKHNTNPSQAVDIAPYPVDWNDNARFILLAGIVLGIAKMQNIKIVWGGDWNGNFNPKDNKFVDLGHFELL